MIQISKLLLFTAILSLSASRASTQTLASVAELPPLASPQYGYGQGNNGYGQGQTITCSSDDGKRNYCNANTHGNVRMINQRSGSACIEGQTWGYDNRRIWVDRGCRADFVVGSNGNGNGNWNGNNGGNWNGGNNVGNGYGQGQTITCSSDDGKRNYCNANIRGGVRMVNQRSGSACIEGQTWGYNNRGIWVDRGCRADFVVGNNGNGNGNWNGNNGGNWNGGNNGGNGYGQGQTITCSSDDGKRNYCDANVRGGVRMINQRSGSACVEGQTWGYDNRGIWVDRGCRADFVIGNR